MIYNLPRRWMEQEPMAEINGLDAGISDESGDG
jgi:hypothetical protein